MINFFKVLANEHRIEILRLLKNPREHFPLEKIEPEVDDFGVCSCLFEDKLGLSQSTTSNYLSSLEKNNLLIKTRIGQWSYYKRNEKIITKLTW